MTYEEAKDAVGTCTACGEWTSVAEPCCNSSVWFEGAAWHWEELEEEGTQ
jgi:hypothetical protein